MTDGFWSRPRRRPLIIAHRGGAALGAENCASTFRAAMAAGADAIETDIRETRDGVLVCLHDADLLRLCGDPRAVAGIDLATLRRLLPTAMTLDEAVAASRPLGLLLDVKLVDETLPPRLLAAAAADDAMGRICLGLRDPALLAATRRLSAEIALLAFAADPDSAVPARAGGANWFRLWQGQATPQRCAAVRAAGLLLAIMVGQPRSVADDAYPPFPVGAVDRAGLDRISQLEPDGILLDDPGLAGVTELSSG